MKWKFNLHDVYFVSTDQSLDQDIIKAAKHLKIDPTTPITYYDNNEPNKPTAGSDSGKLSDSAGDSEQTLHVAAKATKTTNKTTKLRDVPGDVDDATFATDPLEGYPNPDILPGDSITWDGMAN